MTQILLTAYDDLAAYAVLSRLDPADLAEAEAARGAAVTGLSLFADWRAMEPHRILSFVARHSGGGPLTTPFALFGLVNTGQAGVAAAALLACSHRTWRRQLAMLAAQIRRHMDTTCRARGIRRIEARSWTQHPTAGDLLIDLGFDLEATMRGFGRFGDQAFHQFSYLVPPEPAPVPPTFTQEDP